MPDNLYHVSLNVYQVGDVIQVLEGQLTQYWKRLEAENKLLAEERLEAARPATAQTRKTTQYAFADVDDCRNYGVQQYKGALQYYRVNMDNPTVVPMVLVNIIGTTDGTAAQIAALVSEYWNPTLKWSVLECLCQSMTILEKVAPPPVDEYDSAHMRFTSDHMLATDFRSKILKTVK
jgi:hypothetical protein